MGKRTRKIPLAIRKDTAARDLRLYRSLQKQPDQKSANVKLLRSVVDVPIPYTRKGTLASLAKKALIRKYKKSGNINVDS